MYYYIINKYLALYPWELCKIHIVEYWSYQCTLCPRETKHVVIWAFKDKPPSGHIIQTLNVWTDRNWRIYLLYWDRFKANLCPDVCLNEASDETYIYFSLNIYIPQSNDITADKSLIFLQTNAHQSFMDHQTPINLFTNRIGMNEQSTGCVYIVRWIIEALFGCQGCNLQTLPKHEMNLYYNLI